MQALCRARPGELVYLGREYSQFRVAANQKGCEALAAEGLRVAVTAEVHEGVLPVFIVSGGLAKAV